MSIPGQNKSKIAILGTGAVGGFLAALFCRNGYPIVCVDEENSAALIREQGLKLESSSLGNFSEKVRIVTKLDAEPDILFITTKAMVLQEALKRVPKAKVKRSIIVPLLNGIEHLDLLRSIFGNGVVAASIGNVELKRISPGHVVHTTKSAKIEIASHNGISRSRLENLCKMLNSIGIEAVILNSEATVLWGKLVRLNAIAATTAATGKPIGFVRSDPDWRQKLIGCVSDGVAVAKAEGMEMKVESVMESIDKLPSDLGTSMQRDVMAGKQSEVDAISGAVVRRGEKHGIKSPNIKAVIAMIEARGK